MTDEQKSQNCKRVLLDKIMAANLLAQGLSAPEVAKKLGVARQTIYQFAKRNGIKPVNKHPGRPPTDAGREVCLKIKVPLAVKRWAKAAPKAVEALLLAAYEARCNTR